MTGTCGCCEGVHVSTPVTVRNRPGLHAVAYRVGTHARFVRSMLAELHTAGPLRRLVPDPGDPTVALMDAWACVLDVLTFYQERIANEAWLPTATERRSVRELSALIGYRPSPGVAASTYVAFELETGPGAPEEATMPAGTKIQSLPGPDERPQTFETLAPLWARGVWNVLRPRRAVRRAPARGDRELRLEGTATNLAAGDAIVIVGREHERDPSGERWDRELGGPPERPVPPTVEDVHVLAMRRRASLFGHNAPDWRAMPSEIREEYAKGFGCAAAHHPDWPNLSISRVGMPAGSFNPPMTIFLDTVYPKVVAGSTVAVAVSQRGHSTAYAELYRVAEATEESRTDFTMSAKTTKLTLDGDTLMHFTERLRDTVVYAQSERLEIASVPLTDDDVGGDTIELDSLVEDLEPGHVLLVDGVADGVPTVEVVRVRDTSVADGVTVIELEAELAHDYDRDSVRIHGNVAEATHGETAPTEVLGSGDASRAFQTFELSASPLTHTASAGGASSALEVRVDGVRWREVACLALAGPRDRAYEVVADDDGVATVRFGDGRTGARLPTGSENVVATYRTGLGREGNLGVGSLSQLMTRPLGAKGVTNPLPASGGDDPETLGSARRNAPLTVRTLDRIVSLRDFEDFARAFPGIAKARADDVFDGRAHDIHVTVAGVDSAPVVPGVPPHDELVEAIRAAAESRRRFTLGSHEGLRFAVTAALTIDDDHDPETVVAAAAEALTRRFGFEAAELGAPVARSAVMAVLQAVPGVIGVDVDAFHEVGTPPQAPLVLAAQPARPAAPQPLPAQLWTIAQDAIVLEPRT